MAFRFLRELTDELTDPEAFFVMKRKEDWKSAFVFFLSITSIIALVTHKLRTVSVFKVAISHLLFRLR